MEKDKVIKMANNYGYVVSMKAGSKRIRTTKVWRTKSEASKYARETNKFRKGANAKVVKATKKEYEKR